LCGVQTTVKAVTGVLIMNATGRWIDIQRCKRKLLAVKMMDSPAVGGTYRRMTKGLLVHMW
jgi:hypothetical protein